MPKKPKHSHLYIKTLIIHICKFIKKCTMMNVNDRMIKNHLVQLYSVGQVHGRVEQHPDQDAEHFQSSWYSPSSLFLTKDNHCAALRERGEVSPACLLYKQNHIVYALLSLAASVPCVREIHQYGGELNKMIFKASCNSNVLPF